MWWNWKLWNRVITRSIYFLTVPDDHTVPLPIQHHWPGTRAWTQEWSSTTLPGWERVSNGKTILTRSPFLLSSTAASFCWLTTITLDRLWHRFNATETTHASFFQFLGECRQVDVWIWLSRHCWRPRLVHKRQLQCEMKIYLQFQLAIRKHTNIKIHMDSNNEKHNSNVQSEI